MEIDPILEIALYLDKKYAQSELRNTQVDQSSQYVLALTITWDGKLWSFPHGMIYFLHLFCLFTITRVVL